MEPSWLNVVSVIGGLVGTAIIAVATIFLWLVTKSLAKETRRMVEASSRPHVVATVDPNRWSMMHADLNVNNTGNATAYDIQVAFDPPLENGEARKSEPAIPFQRISVLKPGQGVYSYLSDFAPLLGKTFLVTISWRRDPRSGQRETNTYTLNMSDFDGVSRLGSDPLIQIAEQAKKIREDWQSVASGSRRTRVDVFMSSDRLHERRHSERQRRRRIEEQVRRQVTAPVVQTQADDPANE